LPFQCEASRRPLLASGRVWLSRPDGYVTRPDARGSDGQMVRLHVRTLAACPHVYEATRVWTGLMCCQDGDPTTFIKPGSRISRATPQFSHLFWILVSDFSRVFAFSRPLLSFCALLTTFQVLFLVNFILFQFFLQNC
jgi:hypothetical protein